MSSGRTSLPKPWSYPPTPFQTSPSPGVKPVIDPTRSVGLGDLPPAEGDPTVTALSPTGIRKRFRWARRRGHPLYLWPEIPPAAWRASLLEIEGFAARVLAATGSGGGGTTAHAGRAGGDVVETPRIQPPAGASPRALGVAAFTSGLGPLLGRWLEEGRGQAPEEVRSTMAEHLAHARDRADRMNGLLHTVSDLLQGAGVPVGVLKGGHTARGYFPEPGCRPASDLDLAVPGNALSRAESVLATAGFSLLERQSHPRRSQWRPGDEAVELRSLDLTHRDNPITVDLHGSLERDFFGVRTLDLGPFEEVLEPWDRGPMGSRVLGQPALTAYLAAHASEGLHGLTLLRLVELIFVIRADHPSGRLDWGELEAFLDARGGLRFVYPAFELAHRLAPGTVDPGFRRRLDVEAPARMIRVLEGIRPSDAQRMDSLSLTERFMWARSPLEWVRRLVYMLRPRWVEGRAGIARIYLERVWRIVRGRIHLGRDR